jgi:hypothetical protein
VIKERRPLETYPVYHILKFSINVTILKELPASELWRSAVWIRRQKTKHQSSSIHQHENEKREDRTFTEYRIWICCGGERGVSNRAKGDPFAALPSPLSLIPHSPTASHPLRVLSWSPFHPLHVGSRSQVTVTLWSRYSKLGFPFITFKTARYRIVLVNDQRSSLGPAEPDDFGGETKLLTDALQRN